MPKAHLTHAFCVTAECEPGKKKTDWWCDRLTGFVLETRSSGHRTYYLRYTDQGGRARQLKIGRFGEISHEAAVKSAKRLRSEVVLGGDPLAAKKEKRAVPTYAELAKQHIAFAKTYQKSWWSTEGLLNKHVVSRFGRMRLDEITSQDVAKWLAEKAAEGLSPASCLKLKILLGRSYRLAQDWKIAGAENNPVRGVRIPPFDNQRQRYLDRAELDRLLIAARASLSPRLGDIVELLALLGLRVNELLQTRWEQVDLERRTLFVPMSKNGKGRHVPLARAAVDVIQKLPRIEGCPYLVPNPETGEPFVSIKKAWQTARKAARLEDVRLHDLRHTCASGLVNSGASLYVVQAVLGHRNAASAQRYSHLSNDALLAAVDAGAAGLTGPRP